ncbi:DNA-binding NarL/FixJ family response regulator [Marisediminicola sp. UYEF4]|uniref:response regulator transcription factor n=1 Tax=Marisediminicola sp. UYEF4 TaxID=1756384 RepID=UPI003399C2D0
MVDPHIRVVIADDHAHIRSRVRAALDIHMPGGGIHAAQQIGRTVPQTAIVMLTQSTGSDDLFDALRAGASGYVLKGTDPAALPGALRAVLAGEAAMSPALVMRILDEFRDPKTRRFARESAAAGKLSAREWEVMELLADGVSTKDVASRLFLSPTTVRVHVCAVLRKLSLTDRESAYRVLRGDV